MDALGGKDLIVARATASGRGAIAIVRVDGPGTRELIRGLFVPGGRRHPADCPRRAILGRWIEPTPDGESRIAPAPPTGGGPNAPTESDPETAPPGNVRENVRPKGRGGNPPSNISSPPENDPETAPRDIPPPSNIAAEPGAPLRSGFSPQDIIDEGITLFFRAPHSFTGNDLAELHCHGGAAVVRRLIGAAVRLGARPALPGEFTRRAFLNGRLDLAQAEAVADLIEAETEAAARAAQAQLAGGLSRRIEALRRRLIDLAAEIEARIDFPEEGIDAADRARLSAAFDDLQADLTGLVESRRRGRLLREGAAVALVGPPNVGKSSLLNALARTERAIVTPHPGTTRDTVECMIDLAGIPVTLIDTAGLRAADEPVERIGIERTRRAIEQADCVIEVRDATGGIMPRPGDVPPDLRPDLIALNKADLLAKANPTGGIALGEPRPGDNSAPSIALSALTGEGIEQLEDLLERMLLGESDARTARSLTGDDGAVAVNERHAALLDRALRSLESARESWDGDVGGELVTIDLRDALSALDEILGIAGGEAVLDRIFEKFCLGK